MKARFLWMGVLVVAALAFGFSWGQPAVGYAAPTLQEDCISYDPASLYIYQDGAVWVLSDGASRMAAFATQADAELGLQVARLHTQHCFIGRNNTRPDRQLYIFEYWKGSSGLEGSLPENDCIPYDRNNLQIENLGADGWRLNSGNLALMLFDNPADAQQGLDLFRNYDRLCFIGRGTDYITTYLYADVAFFVPGVIVTMPPLQPMPTLPPAAVVTLPPLQPMVTLPPAAVVTLPPAVVETPIGPLMPLPQITLVPFDPIPIPPSVPEDCISYDPNALYVAQSGPVWVLTDGVANLEAFATQADAELGLQVARLHTKQCFIGRSNTRPDRDRYIFEYWKGSSGLDGTLPENDCLPYDRNAIYIVDEGANGWLLTDGISRMLMFDNQTDAQQALDLLRNYDRICYIGRGTDYVMTYLYADVILIDPNLFQPIDPGIFVPIDPGILIPVPGEDCVAYNPSGLVLRNMGPLGWMLTDNVNDLLPLDDLQDAQLAARVALAHSELCYIGRANARPNHDAYVFEYWKSPSGYSVDVPNTDCVSYNPAGLIVVDGGVNGWYVAEGTQTLLLLDTQEDANAARDILANYNELCFVGRDNTRPDRDRYIHTYMRQATAAPPPAPTAVPTTPAPAPSSCPGAPATRLQVGHSGRVTYSTGVPVRLRSGPGVGYPILQLLPEGTTFTVMAGPTCADSYNWWGVHLPSGVEGWVAEGVPGNYFLEPVGP